LTLKTPPQISLSQPPRSSNVIALSAASMSQLQVTGVLYRAIKGKAPIARLALAYRRGETSKIVRNFIAEVTA
jgi:hypothetical protein